jgi:hypothetical protein
MAQAPAPGQPVAPQTPTRDRAPATNGTAIIRGHVLDAATGGPVRRARVMMFTGPNPVSAQTDAEGRFELREVPAGKHSLSVSKAGYLSLYASNNNTPIPPIEIKDGALIERVVLRIYRGGVISGQVIDEFGDPLMGAEIQAMRFRYVNGQRQLAPVMGQFRPVATDDLGAFRLYGLEPGDYYVVARGGRDWSIGPGAPSGDGPAQTFYPGTNSMAEARRVSVRAGRETQGVIFPIALARLARVRGRVVTSNGEPFSGSVSVFMKDAAGGARSFGGPVRPDGTFEVSNIEPGTHWLVARQNDFGGRIGGDSESGRVAITVNGDEINDVVIATSRGATLRGRVVTDDGSALGGLSSFNLTAQAADPSSPFMGGMPNKVNNDGTFEIPGLFERVHLRPAFMAPAAGVQPWTLKAVVVGGQDVTDTGLEVRPGQVIDNVDVVFTRKISRLSGQLKDRRGEQASGWIIVFPSDEARWTPQSRFLRVSRPGPNGTYSMTLPPYDDYLIVAVNGIEDGQWQDPEFLRAVKDQATRFAIGENETKVQDVAIVDWRR